MKGKYKNLNLEERKIIEEMVRTNKPFEQIALKLGRSPSAISKEIRRNGGRKVYSALEAQKRADCQALNKGGNYGNVKKLTNQNLTMSDRVEKIEFQVEIIFDIIKSLESRFNGC
jgi:IS30 family transposase